MNVLTRGLWVVRTSIVTPEAVERLVGLASANRVNTLVVQVRGRGDSYFSHGLEPRAEALSGAPEGFDPILEIRKWLGGSGIRVHGWMNAHYVWSGETPPQSPRHIVNQRPTWLMRRRTGEVSFQPGTDVEGAYTCPSNLDAREHIIAVYLDVARRYGLDGVHFDYIRYPSPHYCFCENCQTRFGEYLGSAGNARDQRSLTELADAFPEEWDRFRRDQITELVRQVYRQVKAERPDITVSAAVFANAEDAFNHRFQDWKGWLREGILDIVCPMAYTTDAAVFENQIQDAVSSVGEEQRVWAGVGAYRMDAADCAARVRIAERCGASGALLFSYGAITAEGDRADYLQAMGEGWMG